MLDNDRVIKDIQFCISDVPGVCSFCSKNETEATSCREELLKESLELLEKQKGLTLALEQANATINYLNEEKEKAIKEIEERKAFNLKCNGQPEWLRKGIDVGLNTALDILKGKDGEQE